MSGIWHQVHPLIHGTHNIVDENWAYCSVQVYYIDSVSVSTPVGIKSSNVMYRINKDRLCSDPGRP